MSDLPAYGHWQLVIVNSLIVLIFVFSFFRPHCRRDWRTFSAFTAFIVALFTEMYGFPLTVYLLSGWLAGRFPEIDWFSHNSSHLLGNAHSGPLHLISSVLIIGGFILLSTSWKELYNAQRINHLATSGPYARVRHPQYAAFVVIMSGFLIQWPTLPTLIMFPVLIIIYIRLAHREEKLARQVFGELYIRYAEKTPRFFPRLHDYTAQSGGI
jgi:protein-S-isoprenylcysteine O-methyltransferase Ste14